MTGTIETRIESVGGRWRLIAVIGLVALGALACTSSSSQGSGGGGMSGMSGMSGSGQTSGQRSSSLAGMPMQQLAAADWQGMKITVAESTPQSYTIFAGTQETQVTPAATDSIHLMVLLADDQTGERIPYATVWATVTDTVGRTVFDERLWPMISRTMGTHYGINVPFPATGVYEISIQVDPPQAARDTDYTQVWTQPYVLTTTFDWKGNR